MSQLSTLFVNDLVFSGIHGSTGRERHDAQRFGVDIKIKIDISRASKSDALDDTYDYKNASNIAQRVIEDENHVLIEKIAYRIAEKISIDPKIHSVDVVLRKLNASSNGVPGIVYEYLRSPQELDFKLLDFDLPSAVKVIEKNGAVSIPILSGSYREALLDEAESYEYYKQPEVVGPAKVREQLSSNYVLRPNSLFYQLKDDFMRALNLKIQQLPSSPFNPPLDFNELSLQLYERGSIGITPHLDGFSCKNLICIFILTGKAKFAICDDREGNNPKYVDTAPGNVILMRAPGFLDSDFRPFHFLSDVTERRIVFGMRQKMQGNSN